MATRSGCNLQRLRLAGTYCLYRPGYGRVSREFDGRIQAAWLAARHPAPADDCGKLALSIFGSSGDVANVPPRAVTIGPRDIQHARLRFDMHSFTEIDGISSWQRMISRLAMHGPVTMQVPMSLNQELRTDVYVSRAIAKPIECIEEVLTGAKEESFMKDCLLKRAAGLYADVPNRTAAIRVYRWKAITMRFGIPASAPMARCISRWQRSFPRRGMFASAVTITRAIPSTSSFA